MKNILIIDDDIHIGNVVEESLIKNGYCVSRAYSGTEAILYLKHATPDLILLDLMLPGMEGEEVLKNIHTLPVIVMSAKIDIDHKVDLLLNGACDYVTKPFVIKELMARIAIHIRNHATANTSSTITYQDIKLDTTTCIVTIRESDIHLTRTENAILKLLMQNPLQVIPKSTLIEQISMDTPDGSESSLKMHISNLRKKLRSIDDNDYIEAVWGIGFKLKAN